MALDPLGAAEPLRTGKPPVWIPMPARSTWVPKEVAERVLQLRVRPWVGLPPPPATRHLEDHGCAKPSHRPDASTAPRPNQAEIHFDSQGQPSIAGPPARHQTRSPYLDCGRPAMCR